ncbi:MAG: glycogen/starch/alpha-glucan phosphorylase [Fastidiosipilaceae bacterium]|jgi:starch phosphorylase|nr:glycogen/starch/alpha-glucan phosphorylase [Clostridiaceae bacterium]
MTNREIIKQSFEAQIKGSIGGKPYVGTAHDIWNALARVIIERIADRWTTTDETYSEGKRAYYFSAEFLMGRSLLNNLINLNLYDDAKELLAEYGYELTDILEQEYDAGLGNGGLGRLAACFLDSCATKNLPVDGYGILYRYGLFRQDFENGFQKEYPDAWMEDGYPLMVRKKGDTVKVHYNDMDVLAVPYDMPITGFGTDNINTLRLWCAVPAEEFDFNLFNSQRFDDAVEERNRVEDIWRVLYPNDTSYDGKVLRVRQQYFFVSASLQDLIRKYKKKYGNDFSKFASLHAFQMNDTHPVVAIPEMMRLLMDDEGLTWEAAWEIVNKTFAYTNHTILSEALEKWDIGIFQFLFPRILEIIKEIDNRFRKEMLSRGLRHDEIEVLAPIADGKVRMAWIACYACFSINGVAALHTEILKNEALHEWYELWPEKFSNKTNGVTPRRWLHNCNPGLSELLTELSGGTDWVSDLTQLAKLESYKDDAKVMKRVANIKYENKVRLANYIKETEGIEVDPNAIFDVQIKRLHEYKRQLLNALYIMDLYYRAKDDISILDTPRVFIFGAKAAPGYVRAKAIIKFINEIAKLVNNDPDLQGKMKVVFMRNYNVSKAEVIIPATDVSEQISTAGMEASGTGNMKFMMNGALTLGTLDGANVEIVESVGEENAYIFGVRVEDLADTKAYYNPTWQYNNIPGLRRAVDALTDGTLNDNNTGIFHDLKNSLLSGSSWQPADVYYVLGDFDDYRKTRDHMAKEYKDQDEWVRRCWINIVRSGRFSSDRTIEDYATEIWKIKPAAI